jgi:hypothetical protein
MFGPIAQFDDSPLLWPDFFRKATSGSYKAAEWLIQADLAAAERLGGRPLVEEADAMDYHEVLRRALPPHPPFGSVQRLLSEAHATGLLRTYLIARSEPFHDRAHYGQLWNREDAVNPAQLLHDAAHSCCQRWDGPAFRRLIDHAETAQLAYNSQDVVAGMLYLSAIQAQPPRNRRISGTIAFA